MDTLVNPHKDGENIEPVINAFYGEFPEAITGGVMDIIVDAFDMDGDKLSFSYMIISGNGTLSESTTNVVTFFAPINTCYTTIEVTIDDGYGGTTRDTMDIETRQPKIFFESDIDGDYEIYVMDIDGTNVVQLTNNTSDDNYPCLSSDSKTIIFYSNRNGDNEIFSMERDGSNQTQLTYNTASDSAPCLSLDGQAITFQSDRDSGDVEVYIMNSDGSNQIRLTNSVDIDRFPWFSPDGNIIIFRTNRWTAGELATMNRDGSNVVQLTNNSDTDEYPQYSYDGALITYSFCNGPNWEIHVMNADRTNDTALTNTSWANSVMSSFSQDGNFIVFCTNKDDGGISHEIYIMRSDGNDKTRLTVNSSQEHFPRFELMM